MQEADRTMLRTAWLAGALMGLDGGAGDRVVLSMLRGVSPPRRWNDSRMFREGVLAAGAGAGDGRGSAVRGAGLVGGGPWLALCGVAAGEASVLSGVGADARAAWVMVRALDRPLATACRALGIEDAERVGAMVEEVEGALGGAGMSGLGGRVVERSGGLAGSMAAGLAGVVDERIDWALAMAGPSRRRARAVAGAQFAALLVCFGLLVFVLVDLLRWDDREAVLRDEALRYSNPMPVSGSGVGVGADEDAGR